MFTSVNLISFIKDYRFTLAIWAPILPKLLATEKSFEDNLNLPSCSIYLDLSV